MDSLHFVVTIEQRLDNTPMHHSHCQSHNRPPKTEVINTLYIKRLIDVTNFMRRERGNSNSKPHVALDIADLLLTVSSTDWVSFALEDLPLIL